MQPARIARSPVSVLSPLVSSSETAPSQPDAIAADPFHSPTLLAAPEDRQQLGDRSEVPHRVSNTSSNASASSRYGLRNPERAQDSPYRYRISFFSSLPLISASCLALQHSSWKRVEQNSEPSVSRVHVMCRIRARKRRRRKARAKSRKERNIFRPLCQSQGKESYVSCMVSNTISNASESEHEVRNHEISQDSPCRSKESFSLPNV